MASKTAIEQRRQNLVDALEKEANGLTYQELENILGKKKRTIDDDIKELRKNGFELEVANGVVKLLGKGQTVMHSSRDLVRKTKILMQLDQKTVEKNNNNLSVMLGRCTEEAFFEKKDRRDKTIEKDLEELAQTGYLIASESLGEPFLGKLTEPLKENFQTENKGKTKYRLGLKAPVNYYMEEREPQFFLELIKEYGEESVFSETLNDIKEQLIKNMQLKLFYGDIDLNSDSILVGNRNHLIFAMEKIIQKLNDCHFTDKWIEVDYAKKDNESIKRIVASGILVYSLDHGKLYLFAKEMTEGILKNTILNTEKIIEIRELPKINVWYQAEEFQIIYDEMFSISVEDCYEVEVIFENIFNINEKLKRLSEKRKYAKLSYKDEKLVYTDRIRGLYDFSKYLRGFGWACLATKPDVLVEQMYNSAKRVCQLYESDEKAGGEYGTK